MLHFIGILSPREDLPEGDDRQKPFFGPEYRLTRAESDVAALSGAWVPEEPKRTDPAETMRFVNLLSPPFI